VGLVTLAGRRDGVHDVLGKPARMVAVIAAVRSAGAGAEAKVLVVDGDAAARGWLERALAEAGCEAVVRADGAAGLAAAVAERPDAVVVDPTMPRLDGVDFLRRLRSTASGARMPVIVWSGKHRSDAGRDVLLAELRDRAGGQRDGR
jgi:CheY-like chemotaxis protein